MSNYKGNSTINQPTEWLDRVRAFCDKYGMSRNDLIRIATNIYMDNYDEKNEDKVA